jgi:hypothetical protein
MAENRNDFHVCTENIPYRKRYGIGKAFYEAFMAFEEKNKKGNEDEKNDEDGAVADRNIRGAL